MAVRSDVRMHCLAALAPGTPLGLDSLMLEVPEIVPLIVSRPSRLILLIPALLLAAAPPLAPGPRCKTCKATCTVLVADTCAGLRKKKAKRCRARIIRQCQHDRIVCAATTTTLPLGATTTTTLPAGSGAGCPTTFLVGPESPGGAEHVATGDFNRDGKLDFVMTANPGVMVRLGNGDGTFGAVGGSDAAGSGRRRRGRPRRRRHARSRRAPFRRSRPTQAVFVAVLLGAAAGRSRSRCRTRSARAISTT